MENDDDPVVSRVNVCLSKRLDGKLLLLQYPVRSAGRTFENVDITLARVKHQQHCVELDIAVDSKQFAAGDNAPGNSKMTLASTASGTDLSRYVIGMVSSGELHLTPLTDIIQLRPSFTYLDSTEQKPARSGGAAAAGESSQDEGEDDTRPVTVRFAPVESEDAVARRMASYEHYRKQADEEPWKNIRHYPFGSYESRTERMNLHAEKKQDSTEFYTQPAKYLNQLIPRMETEVLADASLPSDVLSLAALKLMPREDRIRALMRSVRAIRFTELISVLKSLGEQQSPSSHEFVQDVLRHLQHCSVLVQGCWVVKSEILYAKDSVSEQTGASSSLLRNARDYILHRFHQETKPDERTVVTRRDIADNVAPLTTEDEREILDKIARRAVVRRGWEFRFDRDLEFLNSEHFRHVAKSQETHWQKQEAYWQANKKQTTTLPSVGSPSKSKRSRTRSKSIGAERSMSDLSESEADVSMLQAAKEQPSSKLNPSAAVDNVGSEDCIVVSSSVPARRNLANTAVPADERNHIDINDLLPLLIKTEPGAQPPSSSVESSLSSSESTVSAVNPAVRQALAEFAAERLRHHGVLSVSSLRTQLDVFRLSLPAGHVLSASVTSVQAFTPHALEQALVDSGAARGNGRCENDAVYMLTERGDAYDLLRKGLVEILSSQKSVRLGSLKKALESKGVMTVNGGSEITDQDLKTVLKEYCCTRGGSWTLKESD